MFPIIFLASVLAETDLTGSKGFGSCCGRLLYFLMISRILEVGSGRGLVGGAGAGGALSLAGGLRGIFAVREKRQKVSPEFLT